MPPLARLLERVVGRWVRVYSRRWFFPEHSFNRRHNVLRTAREDDLCAWRVGMDDVENAIEPDSGFFRCREIHSILSVDVAADGHAIVLGSLQLRHQPCVPSFIVREHEGGRLEPERTEFLLDGGRDLLVLAESEDAPTRVP